MGNVKVGGVYVEIQAKMDRLESDLKSIEGRLQRTDNTANQFSGTMGSLGKYLAGGTIAYGLLNIGKAALSASANMEKQKVAFTTTLGSAQKAQKLLDEMQQFAASTPFEFNEIVDASKKLISFYGSYVNEKTINYVSKYMTKKDEDNPDYIGIVLCSKGLGANYAKENQLYRDWETDRKSTRLNSSHRSLSRMPSSA